MTTTDDDPYCPVCQEPCGKTIGVRKQTVNTFWGGKTHGSKVFYTDDHTYYFCSEVHRTEFFYGPARNDEPLGDSDPEANVPGE